MPSYDTFDLLLSLQKGLRLLKSQTKKRVEIWREKLRGEGGWRAVASGMWQYPRNEVAVWASWLRCAFTFTINILLTNLWFWNNWGVKLVKTITKNQRKCRHFSGTKAWEILDTNLLTAILLDNKNYELMKNLLYLHEIPLEVWQSSLLQQTLGIIFSAQLCRWDR